MSDLDEGLALLENLSTKERKLCIETLIKIFRNVESNPNDVKYRSLKLSNKRFLNEVWIHEGAQIFMLASGWVLLEEIVHLPEGTRIGDALAALIANRDVKPDEAEWVEDNKIVGMSATKIREEELKKKALEQKEKEMAKLKRDMAERKEIAERILREHRNDIENRRINRPSVAAPRGSGKSAKMSDIVPKQGGG